jgi:hypothetical protein
VIQPPRSHVREAGHKPQMAAGSAQHRGPDRHVQSVEPWQDVGFARTRGAAMRQGSMMEERA